MDPALVYGIITGVAAVITACAGLASARSRGHKECRENLKEARREAEELAEELHKLRMKE